MSLASVGSTRSVLATLGLPWLTACVLSSLHCSGSRLLYRERAYHYVHFPAQAAQVQVLGYSTKRQTGLGLCFVPFLVRGAQATRSLRSTLSLGAVRLLPSPSRLSFRARRVRCPLCLFWGADLWWQPCRGMSTIQNLRKSLVRNWKPVCSLVGDALCGAEFAPSGLWLGPPPPVSSRGWAGPQPASSSLVLLSSLFYKWASFALLLLLSHFSRVQLCVIP